MDAHTCNHPSVSHTVSWHLVDSEDSANPSKTFGHLEDADIFAQKILRQNKDRLLWLKIYRADNETYTCFVWNIPPRKKDDMAESEDMKVKLEVDMEPLASAFENVALGFKNQGASIKRLTYGQAILGTAVLIDLGLRFFS